MVMKKQFALRETPKGYVPTELEISQTNFGGIRKFSHDTSFCYKKPDYALKQATKFYSSLYTRYHIGKIDLEYIGIISNYEYRGEPA